jgi:ubiquinone biosynthesis protein
MELLSKYGFSYLFSRIKVKKHPEDRGYRIRKLLEELGPTFIKLGQMLSTRYDILPVDIIQELVKLQDNVPPIGFEEYCSVLDEKYKKRESVFLYIQEKPLGTASIAQVHRAILSNGKEVVVKVRKPGAKETVKNDVVLLANFAQFAQHFPFFKDFDLIGLIEDFGRSIAHELDFMNEVNALEQFRQSFRMNELVKAPEPFKELCYENILVMEYVPGIRFSELLTIPFEELPYPVDKSALVNAGADCLFQQCFILGFLHADPHPGNLIVTREGKLYFIDFGQVTVIDKHTRRFLLEMIIALTKRDAILLSQLLLESFPLENEDHFITDIRSMFAKYYGKSLSDFKLSELLLEEFKTIRKYRIKIPGQLLLMGKVILEIEGIARNLDPSFNAIRFMESYLNKRWISLLSDRYSAANEEILWSALMLPRKIQQLSKLFDSGKVNLEISSPKIERKIDGMRKSVNILAISIIIAALVIGLNNFENQTVPYIALAVLGVTIIYGILFGERRN